MPDLAIAALLGGCGAGKTWAHAPLMGGSFRSGKAHSRSVAPTRAQACGTARRALPIRRDVIA